jgi:hypothetical protein
VLSFAGSTASIEGSCPHKVARYVTSPIDVMRGKPSTAAVRAASAAVLRDLRRGDLARAVYGFRAVPHSGRTPALHEAMILACAHVPDAPAATAVLRSMPEPTLAAYAHVATAHCREHNHAAAVALLEELPAAGLPVDQRVLDGVARHVRNVRLPPRVSPQHTSSFFSSNKRPRQPPSERQLLLARLERLANAHADRDGLRSISLDTTGFFDDDSRNFAEWMASKNLGRQQSLNKIAASASAAAPEAGSARVLAANSISSMCAAGTFPSLNNVVLDEVVVNEGVARTVSSITAALRAASGNITSVDKAWRLVTEETAPCSDIGLLSTGVGAYLACGWRGNSRALDALTWWLDSHALDQAKVAATLNQSPTKLALLLTAATSALAASASSTPHRALETYETFISLPVPAFLSSLPLSGALFKILRHARLPLHLTVARIDDLREQHIQLDEQSFSLALAAILQSSAPAAEKWAYAKLWLGKMRAAGMPLTVHTYNAFAAQLRVLHNPEMASSLLGDMALDGVAPSASTYGLVFDSCVIPGPYTAHARRSALNTNVLLRMLRAIEDSMAVAAIPHSLASRLSLARAYAHLGETSIAFQQFEMYESMLSSTAGESGYAKSGLCGEDDDPSAKNGDQQRWGNAVSPFRTQRVYNQMLFNLAHCRCLTPAGPAAAFRMYDRMREANVLPNAATLEALLAACVRVGNTHRALEYASEFADLQAQTGEPFVLRCTGIECLLTTLSNSATPQAWAACEPLLEPSFAEQRRVQVSHRNPLNAQQVRPIVSTSVVELAVLAFARNRNKSAADRIIALTGFCPEEWEMALNGHGDFRRFRSARSARRDHKQREGDYVNGVACDSFVSALKDDHTFVVLT